MRLFAYIVGACAIAAPALADFQPIRQESQFREVVTDRELTRLGLRLQVLPQGQITGRGFGMNMGGQWE